MLGQINFTIQYNFCLGIFWRQFMSPTGAVFEAWKYLSVVIPIIVIFGPLGSYFGSHIHRYVKAILFNILSIMALVRDLLCLSLIVYYKVMA